MQRVWLNFWEDARIISKSPGDLGRHESERTVSAASAAGPPEMREREFPLQHDCGGGPNIQTRLAAEYRRDHRIVRRVDVLDYRIGHRLQEQGTIAE